MRTNNGWVWVAAIVLGAGLVWGLEQVVLGPLETGDVYPPYSSLRTDPLGAKALYERQNPRDACLRIRSTVGR